MITKFQRGQGIIFMPNNHRGNRKERNFRLVCIQILLTTVERYEVAFSRKRQIQAIIAIEAGRLKTSCILLTNLDLHNYIRYIYTLYKKTDFSLVLERFYVYKQLDIKKIQVIFKMTNENVRLDSSFFSYKNTTTF